MFKRIELFHFSTADEDLYYNSGNRDITGVTGFPGETFIPADGGIKRKKWNSTLRNTKGEIITTADLRPAADFIIQTPALRWFIAVYDRDGTLQLRGVVVGVVHKKRKHEISLKVEAMSGLNDADIPLDRYQSTCRFDLGDSRCGINLATFSVTFLVSESTIDGRDITHTQIGTESDGFWELGYVENGSKLAFVAEHTGNTITLLEAFQGSLLGANFVLRSGCKKRLSADCISKFSNDPANHGGCPFIPEDNPVVNRFRR